LKSFVERAKSGRATCVICAALIAKDEVRIVEETLHERHDHISKAYSHLACSIEQRRDRAHDALAARETPGELVAEVIAEVERLDAKLADEVRETRERRVRVIPQATPLDDPQTLQLLAELEINPRDRGLLAVLADHLQLRGDERGELIALDLAGSLEPAALVRRRELSAALSPKVGLTDRATWGIGFVKKLEVTTGNKDPLSQLEALFAHPSCRLVEVVVINRIHRPVPVPLPPGMLPASVRRIELGGGLAAGSEISGLPHLEHVLLDRFVTLAHPTLPALVLDDPLRETFDNFVAAELPGVKHLVVQRYRGGGLIEKLERGGWFAQLDDLELVTAPIELGELRILERALAGRKLARLALYRCGLSTAERPRLAALCETLELQDPEAAAAGTVSVEHANKPEWGRGVIVREYDGKIDVEFPAVGKKTFKADASFLVRLGRDT
jgi:hypothetical protein